ncbi:MAG: FtsQ-type POTRA domain-containing protein [Clostridia bacterium]|nr:FtsQ-type POTRA domain-containing protein [Clostridia bacterium]
MSKGERRRTMVYSNVNKKADSKSASRNDEIIDLDKEIIIGIQGLPNPNESKKNNKVLSKKLKNKKQDNKPVKKKIQKIKNETESEELQNRKATKQNNSNEQKPLKKFINIKKDKQDDFNPIVTKEDRIKMQKRKIIKKLSAILLLIVLLIGGFIYFLLSPAFNVKSIEVLNNNHISAQEITAISSIKVNENMFKYSKKEVKGKMVANPYIEDVKIKRNIFTRKVIIDVKERVASLMLEYGNSYVYIDNQGYILEISQAKLKSPILKGYVTPLEDIKPGKRLNKDDLERLEVVLNIIKNANDKGIADLITNISIKDKKEYVMFLESEDKTVYLGKCTDLSTQMLYVKEMLEREKNIEGEFYVDMDLNTSNPMFKENV